MRSDSSASSKSKLYLLDREDGLTIYGAQTGHLTDDWFSGQSNVDQAAAIASGAVDPDDYRVTVNAHKGYNVYRTNGVNYILAHDGDTFEKISRDFRISARNLRKFNDVGKNAQPVANEVIYIGRKKKRWDGNVLLHTVREGRNPLVARTVLRHPHQIAGTSEQTQGRRCADPPVQRSRYDNQSFDIAWKAYPCERKSSKPS